MVVVQRFVVWAIVAAVIGALAAVSAIGASWPG
jgi:hypothetical protein